MTLELLEADAPKTVANFLNYIENDRYQSSLIHRSINGFIIQGGGFLFDGERAVGVLTFPEVENEFKVSNMRGTVAMAKRNNPPNSATSQWFINVGNNASNLDGRNGGFTIFARVIGDGMAVVDAINQLPRVNAGGAFTDLPVIDFPGNVALTTDNLVMTTLSEKLAQVSFVMNAGFNDA